MMRTDRNWRGLAATILALAIAGVLVGGEVAGRPVPDGILGAIVGLVGAYIIGRATPWGR